MSKTITTESVESGAKVYGGFEVFDLFFVMGFMMMAFLFRGRVADPLLIPYYFFMLVSAVFLTARSRWNRKRRNFVSLYFMLTKDSTVYRIWQRR